MCHPGNMSNPRHTTHADPVWRHRSNWIVQVDLTPYGFDADTFEQLWVRTDDESSFEVCCIPFFTYGIALGDLIELDRDSRVASVVHRSGRKVIRVAFGGRAEAAIRHEQLHGLLVTSGALHEFSSSGYVSVDLQDQRQADAVVSALQPLVDAGAIMWEWGSE